MEIIFILVAGIFIVSLLFKHPKAAFVMLLLGGVGWFIGDSLHYAPIFLSILGGAIGLVFTTQEFGKYLLPLIIIPITIGIIGNLIGNIFSPNWGTYGALFALSAIIGFLLYLMTGGENELVAIAPALLLLIGAILNLVLPGIFSAFSWLFDFIKNIFSSGWAIWAMILAIFGIVAMVTNAKKTE